MSVIYLNSIGSEFTDKQDPLHTMTAFRNGMYDIASSYWYKDQVGDVYCDFKFISYNPNTDDTGFSINLDNFSLESGKTYRLSFTTRLPSGLSLLTNNRFGIKHSNNQLQSFNTDPDVSIRMTDQMQTVSMTFTAGATNYFNLIFGALRTTDKIFYFDNFKIEEV